MENFYDKPEGLGQTREQNPSTTWGQERRLEFIDFRLRWEGTVNRADLRAHFGISTPQASLDIAKYAKLAPKNLAYDRRSRTYRAGEQFTPLSEETSPQRYLNEVFACSQGMLDRQTSYIGWMPPFAGVPVPSRHVPAETLSLLVGAMRHQGCVRITYQSDSEAHAIDRVIAPHAFGYDGFRWHVRAYCLLRQGYRDFVMGRMLAISHDGSPGRSPTLDEKWHRILELKIGANPALREGNRRAVELDYSMLNGVATICVREALLYYVLKQLSLGPFASSGLQVTQIVLLNTLELERYIGGIVHSRALPDRAIIPL